MSLNNHECVWGKNGCNKFLTQAPFILKPLACGEMHKKLFGTTGYEDPKQWCEIGKVNLLIKKQAQSQAQHQKIIILTKTTNLVPM